MDNRNESSAIELSELITLWANAWAKEKGALTIAWVEHTKAAADARLKWKMGGHTKEQKHGLTLVISAEEAVVASDSVLTEATQPPTDTSSSLKTVPPEPITLLCEPGKSVAAEARKLQEQHFADAACKITLSGNVVVYCNQKVDPKLDSHPGAHHKWTIGIETVMTDLIRFAALDDAKIITAQDKERVQNALKAYTTDSAAVSFILPPCERKTAGMSETKESALASTTAVKVTTPPQNNSSIMARFGFRGTQGKGATTITTVPPVEPTAARMSGPGTSSTN